MTLTEFRRMKVFALRMTRVAIGRNWQKRLYTYVHDFLTRMEGENNNMPYQDIVSWDHSNNGRCYLCDAVTDYTYSHGLKDDSALEKAVSICVRAGCDMAAEPSAGVVGFTVGDLRKMWAPRELPDWVTEGWTGEAESLRDVEDMATVSL